MTRPTTIRGPLRELVDRLGGVGLAAKRIGVDRRTLRRWGTGETWPTEEMLRLVNRMARRFGLREPF
jgi:hypothetical protein